MLRFIADPGHGWLEVPVEALRTLKIASKISSYSYRKGSMAYLEEDCDAPLFMETFYQMFGVRPTLHRVFEENTAIRGYSDYYV